MEIEEEEDGLFAIETFTEFLLPPPRLTKIRVKLLWRTIGL